MKCIDHKLFLCVDENTVIESFCCFLNFFFSFALNFHAELDNIYIKCTLHTLYIASSIKELKCVKINGSFWT